MEYIDNSMRSEFISDTETKSWADCPQCSGKIEQGCQVCPHCKYRMTAHDLQPEDHLIRNNFMWFAIIGVGCCGLLIGLAASLLP